VGEHPTGVARVESGDCPLPPPDDYPWYQAFVELLVAAGWKLRAAVDEADYIYYEAEAELYPPEEGGA